MSFWGSGSEEALDVEWLSSWDVVTLGGETLPGRCVLRGQFARKIDVKQAPGRDGSTLTDLGYEPARIELTIWLWTEEHWEAFERLVPRIRPRPGKGMGEALDVSHPATSLYGIKSVYVERMGLPQDGAVKGVKEVSVGLIEVRRTTPVVPNTPRASKRSLTDLRTVAGTPPAPPSPAQSPAASEPFSSADQNFSPGS